uniref:Uncharacterized protein n=1 Tax=Picea glauca TaxID=3330 RepID=A0A101LYF3_PICGL|nr:hypothetical protein ABT39_MTgene5856 [Picea glauca]QHR92122.1 hypothetical protein Q903MT_gene6158 [Picea sitchensis]
MSKSFHCIPRVYPVWVHSVQHILWCVCSFSSFRPPRPSRDVSIYLFPLPFPFTQAVAQLKFHSYRPGKALAALLMALRLLRRLLFFYSSKRVRSRVLFLC